MSLDNVKSESVEYNTEEYTEQHTPEDNHHKNTTLQIEQVQIKIESVEETETKNFSVCSQQDILSQETEAGTKQNIDTDFVKEEEEKFVAEINNDSLLDFIKEEIKHEGEDKIASFSVSGFGAIINYQSIDEESKPRTETELNKEDDIVQSSSVTDLNHHDIPVKHSLQRKNVCTICSKSFSHPSHLVRHMRIHSGDRPFACSVCGKAFSQKGIISEHIKIQPVAIILPIPILPVQRATNNFPAVLF